MVWHRRPRKSESPGTSKFLGDRLVGMTCNLTQQRSLTDLGQISTLCDVEATALTYRVRGNRDTSSPCKPQGNLPRMGLARKAEPNLPQSHLSQEAKSHQRKRPATNTHQVSPLGHVKAERTESNCNPATTQFPSSWPWGAQPLTLSAEDRTKPF